MHSLVALPLTFHLSLLQRIESSEPPPREKMLASHSLRYILTIFVYIVYLADCQPDTSYLTVLGFVVLFGAHPPHP